MSWRPLLGAIALLVIVPSCRTSDFAFRVDKRVEIVQPKNNRTVTLPVTVRWTVHDFTGTFAIFVDSSPIPPRQTMRYVARDDRSCRAADGCPDETYLSDRQIFTTMQTSLTLPALRDTRPPSRRSAKDRHEVNIILMDARGHRIGESVVRVAFFVDRGD
jgi:hypothetical protein